MTRRERKEARLQKRLEWAEKRAQQSSAEWDKSHAILDPIPLGQPVLVGHHSEKRHRRALERADNAMRRAVESSNMAKEHRSKADGIERQLETSIFSDDTDAVEALQARIAENEAKRDRMKEINRLYRKGDAAGLAALGLNLETLREKMKGAYSWEAAPYPGYSLTNLGARIRADKERIKAVQTRAARAQRAEATGGTCIEESNGYAQVTFAEYPGRPTIQALKEAGFHYSGGSWFGNADRLPASIREDQ